MRVFHSPSAASTSILTSAEAKAARSTLSLPGRSTASAGFVASKPWRRALFRAVRITLASRVTVLGASPALLRAVRPRFRGAFWPVEDDDIPHPGDQMAAALFRELRRQFLLLLFELVELHLDEFMVVQFQVQGRQQLRTEAFLAELERGLEPLGLGLESARLRIGER